VANAPVHFEIPADDVARAKAFYEKTFGWKIKLYPMPAGSPEYFGVTTRKKGEPGIDGGLMKRNMPGQPFTNYLSVKSIDAMNQTVQKNGGVIVLPKQAIGPNMGWISVFKDTENNFLRANQQGGGDHVANCGYMTAQRAWGRGVARAMCAHSLERARQRGFRAMQFNFVVSTNQRAVRIWQGLGFEIVGRLPGAFHHPEMGYVDALVMYLGL